MIEEIFSDENIAKYVELVTDFFDKNKPEEEQSRGRLRQGPPPPPASVVDLEEDTVKIKKADVAAAVEGESLMQIENLINSNQLGDLREHLDSAGLDTTKLDTFISGLDLNRMKLINYLEILNPNIDAELITQAEELLNPETGIPVILRQAKMFLEAAQKDASASDADETIRTTQAAVAEAVAATKKPVIAKEKSSFNPVVYLKEMGKKLPQLFENIKKSKELEEELAAFFKAGGLKITDFKNLISGFNPVETPKERAGKLEIIMPLLSILEQNDESFSFSGESSTMMTSDRIWRAAQIQRTASAIEGGLNKLLSWLRSQDYSKVSDLITRKEEVGSAPEGGLIPGAPPAPEGSKVELPEMGWKKLDKKVEELLKEASYSLKEVKDFITYPNQKRIPKEEDDRLSILLPLLSVLVKNDPSFKLTPEVAGMISPEHEAWGDNFSEELDKRGGQKDLLMMWLKQQNIKSMPEIAEGGGEIVGEHAAAEPASAPEAGEPPAPKAEEQALPEVKIKDLDFRL